MPFGSPAPLPLRLGGSAEEGVTPEQHARFCADLVAVTRVAPFASGLIDTTPLPEIVEYSAQRGFGSYYHPSLDRVGTGNVRLTWTATETDPPPFEDEFGIHESFTPRIVIATANFFDTRDAMVNWTLYAPSGSIIGVEFNIITNFSSYEDGLFSFSIW